MTRGQDAAGAVAGRDPRSPERLRAHYLVERELADRLRTADAEERTRLYGELYDELYARVPDHPQLTAKADPAERTRAAERQARILERFAGPDATIMEIGAGDCVLARRLARRAARVIAVDVSATVTGGRDRPANLELRLIDGCTIPATPGSVDLAFSDQLMEHLHPDDALRQARDIARALRRGGAYVCVTPSRLTGPHDISGLYDDVPRGFHLREYATGDVVRLLREAGFARVRALIVVRDRAWAIPAAPIVALERLLDALPRGRGRWLARRTPLRKLLGSTVAYVA
ncbi:methyltransferase domain-containing protein [Patulibacter sp. S7RM1-6]